MNRRAELLAELVQFRTPAAPLLHELQSLGWDWQLEPLLILKKEHLLNVINRFLGGELSAEQLQEWAENLECREDIAFEEKDRAVLDSVFFRLATPFINTPLTHQSVSQMKNELLEG